MLKTAILLIIAISGLLMISCTKAEPPKLSAGMLIWTPGNNYIYQWNSKTGKKSVLLKLPYLTIITSLGKIDSDAIVFSATSPPSGKGKNPYDAINRIYVLTLKTKKVQFLHNGLVPTYIPQHHKLIFIGPEDYWLTADFNGGVQLGNIRKIHPGGAIFVDSMGGSIIQVSAYKIVFYYVPLNNDPPQVLIYNLNTDEWKTLPLVGCVPQFWRVATKQLLCTKGDSPDYYLTDLESGRVVNINTGEIQPTVFFLYLHDSDAALAIRPGSFSPPEREDIWIYYFKTGKWKRLIRDAGASLGSAVWISNQNE